MSLRSRFAATLLSRLCAVAIFALPAVAQPTVKVLGTMSTIAGTGSPGYSGNGGQATAAQFNGISGLAVDASGTIYIADTLNNQVRRINGSGVVSRLAGSQNAGFNGDGQYAINALLNAPTGVAADGLGNIYIADAGNYRIRMVSPSGIITTVAGTGSPGYSGDNGPASNAQINWVAGIAVDAAGNLYIADTLNQRLRMVSATTGTITTLAGNGTAGYNASTTAVSAELNMPSGVAVDFQGNVYIADRENNLVRQVSPAGLIANYAGTGTAGYSGDGGAAISALLNGPAGLALDSSGNLYIADANNGVVRKVAAVGGAISTAAGSGTLGNSGDGLPGAQASFGIPWGLAVDIAGDLLVGDYLESVVRKLSTLPYLGLIPLGQSSPVATVYFSFSGAVQIGSSSVLTLGNSGFDFSATTGSNCTGSFTAGQSCQVNVIFTPVSPAVRKGALVLYDTATPPNALATVYLAGRGSAPAVAFYPGVISTVAGNGQSGTDTGDGGQATSAVLGGPVAVAVDALGDRFIAEQLNNVVRKVTSTGVISTLAGNGNTGYSGDGGPAIQAELYAPGGVAVDGAGNVYISDIGNNAIRMVTPGGIIRTIAGGNGAGYSGDGGPATAAQLDSPAQIFVDTYGNLYIADSLNNAIRRVDTAGIISTVAGNGTFGYSGDGGAAMQAQLGAPLGITADSNRNLYIADTYNYVVRKVSPLGVITTVAGNHTNTYSGDGGSPTSAGIGPPTAITSNGSGDLFISTPEYFVVRKIAGNSASISTFAGNGVEGYSGDGGSPLLADLDTPEGLTTDRFGDVYITDFAEGRVRKVTIHTAPSLTFPTTIAGSSSAAQTVTVENVGSAPLVLSQLSIGANFTLASGSSNCTGTTSLNPAFTCLLNISFAPASANGTESSTLTLTDNALNVSGSTQTLNLQGQALASGTPAAAPVISLPSGVYPAGQAVTLSSSTPSAVIYYTLDGSTPGTSSPVFTTVVTIYASATLKAAAIATGYSLSPVSSASYTIEHQTQAPVISLGSGVYTTPQQVTITDPESGAVIYYTLDGSTPSTSSKRYSGAMTLNGSVLLQAIAVVNGEIPSQVSSAEIEILLPPGTAYNAGTVALGSSSTGSSGITFSFSATTKVGSVAVLTQGIANMDFTNASGTGSTYCAAVTYSSGQSCQVVVKFAPTAPGMRMGAVVLYDTATPPNPVQTVYVSGIGQGPAAVFPPGTMSTVAGTGVEGYTGDGGQATSADMRQIFYSLVDAAGNLYLSDSYNFRIRKVNPQGVITTIAGTGTQGYSGDGGLAINAELMGPQGLAIDGAGNLYFSDTFGSVVRMISPSGIITTVAGNGSTGYSGDNGPATSAALYSPYGLAVDGAGNLYIADVSAFVVRKVASNGTITTVAGNGTGSYSGDGGLATTAGVIPSGVAVDSNGNLYIADYFYGVIREVTGGVINRVAGNGNCVINSSNTQTCFSGDGGPALDAEFNTPWDVQVDAAGNLYITDQGNNRIRFVSAANGQISTIAGSGPIDFNDGGYGGDGGPATSALLNEPNSVTLDPTGKLYISDLANARVRKLDATTPAALNFGPANVGTSSAAQVAQVRNIGNAALNFSAIAVPTGFSTVSISNQCVTGTPLPSANKCQLALTMQPAAAGPVSGSLVLTDNNLGGTNVKQTFQLSGTGAAANSPAAAPLFSPPGGSYQGSIAVTITDATATSAGPATIRYTLDGSTPTSSSTLYSGPITLSSSKTLQAAAFATGYAQSATTSASYSVSPPAPVFSVPAGTYSSAQTVSISATAGAAIYYTTNGTTPTSGSTLYSSPVSVSSSELLQAIAVVPGLSPSAVSSAAYVIRPVAATPVISPAAGNYSPGQTITITSSTPGAVIYYSTDGVTPPGAGTIYSAPFTLNSSMTVQAVALAPGYLISGVASASFTLPTPPVITALSPASTNSGGTAGLTLTVTGSNFNSSSVVLWNGQARATVRTSSTQLTATITKADITAPGTAQVSVGNLSPVAAISSAAPFAVQPANPVISSATVADAASSGGSYQLSVNGSGFVTASTVHWNGSSLPTVYISPRQLSATLPGAGYAQHPVTVVNSTSSASVPFALP